MFHSELRDATGRLPVEVEEGLWDLVARGIVTADGFQAVRSLLSARQAWKRRHRHEQPQPTGRRAGVPTWREGGEGRWALLPRSPATPTTPTPWPSRWRDSSWPAGAWSSGTSWPGRTWPCRGVRWCGPCAASRPGASCGAGASSPASPASSTRCPKRSTSCGGSAAPAATGETVRLNAADPLNLVGIILPGPRVPAVRTNTRHLPRRHLHVTDGVVPAAGR